MRDNRYTKHAPVVYVWCNDNFINYLSLLEL